MKTIRLLRLAGSICLLSGLVASPFTNVCSQAASKTSTTPEKLITLRAVTLHTSPWEMNVPFEELVKRIMQGAQER